MREARNIFKTLKKLIWTQNSCKLNLIHLAAKFVLITNIVLISILLLTTPGYTKSYQIDHISIQAQILRDGSLQIEESRTYTFEGKFSWADYRIPLKGIGEINNFILNDQEIIYKQSTEKKAGTYYLQKAENSFYVRWFYKANNEIKTFTLSYLVTNVVTAYQDIAEFYYKFVGESNAKPIGEVSVRIKLPGVISKKSVKAWAHGPLWGSILFETAYLKMDVRPLPAKTFWEARVLFPKEWVPETRRRETQTALPTILRQEKEWAQKANEVRERAQEQLRQRKENEKKAWPIAITLSLLNIIGLAVLYLKYGRGISVPYYQKIDSELPEDQSPAIVSTLYMNKQVHGAALSATLFDLARRGYITIEQISPPIKRWWGTTKPEIVLKLNREKLLELKYSLLDFERDLIDFTFDELGKGNSTVPLKMFRKNRSKVRRWFQKWQKMVQAQIKDIPYYEKSSIRGTVYAVILCIVVISVGVLIMVFLGKPGLLSVLTGGLTFGFAFAILRYTPDIKLKRKKWRALRRYLMQYHFIENQHRNWLTNIEKYLVFGLALGVGHKGIKMLMESIPEEEQSHYFPWYSYPHGAYASPSDFATAISSVVRVASSTISSTSGSGGGASGGGGGGGGGASGGAG